MIELYQLVKPHLDKYKGRGVSYTVDTSNFLYRIIINDIPRLQIYYRDIWVATVADNCMHFHVSEYNRKDCWHIKLLDCEFNETKLHELMQLTLTKTDELKRECAGRYHVEQDKNS